MKRRRVLVAFCIFQMFAGLALDGAAEEPCSHRAWDIYVDCPNPAVEETEVLSKEHLPGRSWTKETDDGERIYDAFPERRLHVVLAGKNETVRVSRQFYECIEVGESVVIEYCPWDDQRHMYVISVTPKRVVSPSEPGEQTPRP